jgi:hypothetical protein
MGGSVSQLTENEINTVKTKPKKPKRICCPGV